MTTGLATHRSHIASDASSRDAEALGRLLARAQHLGRSLDVHESLRTVGEALRLARRLHDRQAQMQAFCIATVCHYYRGDFVAAVATGLDACVACPDGDRSGRSNALQSVALAFLSVKDLRRAESAARHALRHAADEGNAAVAANSRNVLGLVLSEDSRYDEAYGEFRRARAIFRKLGDAERISAIAVNTGHALRRQGMARELGGDHSGAARRWRRARSVYRTALGAGRPRVGSVMVQAALADCEMRLGGVEAAHALLVDASRHLRPKDPVRITARISCLLGEAERRMRSWPDAGRHLRRALESADSIAGDDLASECRECLSRLASDRGLQAEAREWQDAARHERQKQRQALVAFRREMRPLWKQYLTHESD